MLDAPTIFALDSKGLHEAEAVVAWLDGPMVDDGTACEIGVFTELVRTKPRSIPRHHRLPTGGCGAAVNEV